MPRARQALKWHRQRLLHLLRIGARWFVVGYVILMGLVALTPIWVVTRMVLEVILGGWVSFLSRDGLYEMLLAGIGTTAALGSVGFGYARAAKEGSWDARLGFDCGRMFLFSSATLFLVLISEFARREFLLEAVSREPVWLRSVSNYALPMATGIATILATGFAAGALLWLYFGGVRLIWLNAAEAYKRSE